MSFHLPYRGLSPKLRDMIFKRALCPPEGLTIEPIWPSEDDEDLKFKCVQPVASALLRTNRQVYDATFPLLYSGNVFSLHMTCEDALQLLQDLRRRYRRLIKNLNLPIRLMSADDQGNRQHAEELSRFIIDKLRLETVTLRVPDDLHAGTHKSGGQYDWFMWTLHVAFVQAFQEGHFHEIRFAHPEPYAENLSVYEFHNKSYIEKTLLEKYSESLAERRALYENSALDAQRNGTICQDTLDAVHEFERDLWHRAGYTIERDISRPGEKGTVLVVRRIAASLKRRHEEDGSTLERKRIRD